MKNIDDTYDYNCSDDDDDDSNCENHIKKISRWKYISAGAHKYNTRFVQ